MNDQGWLHWLLLEPHAGKACYTLSNIVDRILSSEHDDHKIALAIGTATITYKDLRLEVAQIVENLRPAFKPTTRVGLLANSSLNFLKIYLAAISAELTVAVFDARWSERELLSAVGQVDPVVIFTDKTLRKMGKERVVVPGAAEIDSVLAGVMPKPPGRLPRRESEDPSGSFYITFTSGSTGRARAVIRSHSSWLHTFQQSKNAFELDSRSHIAILGPLDNSHFLYGAIQGLWEGATVEILPTFDAVAAYRMIQETPVNAVYLLPSMLTAILDLFERDTDPPSPIPLRRVLSSGARLDKEDELRFGRILPTAKLTNFYGATELSFVTRLDQPFGAPPDSVGQPFPGVEVQVRGPNGEHLAVGEVGRLFVRSDMTFSGYIEDGSFVPAPADGWCTVGDLGYVSSDGQVTLLGRASGIFISNGYNIVPEEIEEILEAAPGVRDAVVFGVPTRGTGHAIHAVLVARAGNRLDRAAIHAEVARQLARYKWPRKYYQIDEIPRTRTGKVARQVLEDEFRAGTTVGQLL